MNEMKVRELMIPIDAYPSVSEDSTLLDAIFAFEEAIKKRDRNRQPFRAVLVVNKAGRIVGKLGQLAFLKALEPRNTLLNDLTKISQVGVTQQILETVAANFDLFKHDLNDLCASARYRKVSEVMHPISEMIDTDAPMTEAIQKFVMWQVLSIPVNDEGKIVGLLRLSDLCQAVAEEMKNCAQGKSESNQRGGGNA